MFSFLSVPSPMLMRYDLQMTLFCLHTPGYKVKTNLVCLHNNNSNNKTNLHAPGAQCNDCTAAAGQDDSDPCDFHLLVGLQKLLLQVVEPSAGCYPHH
jgi:hypothetical protein